MVFSITTTTTYGANPAGFYNNLDTADEVGGNKDRKYIRELLYTL
jgi:hypothetical protein